MRSGGGPEITPEAYAAWRATTVGRMTESIEADRIFELAGSLQGLRVLDVGAGDGCYTIGARGRGAHVVGLEPGERMLDAARTRSSSCGLGVPFVRGRGETIPFREASFHVVLAVTTLCFVANAEKSVREMARVLVPGGRLVIGELGRWNAWAAARRIRAWRGDHTWRQARFWSPRDLRSLVEGAGLRVGTLHGAIYYPPLAWAARAIGPADRWLGQLPAPGAAFLALSAEKVVEAR